jgi:hypothetical protein
VNIRAVTVACSLVFVIGTVLQNVVVIDLTMMRRAMELAGAPAEDASGFMAGLRLVGWVFVVGNALGLFALSGRRWLFWVVLAVNAGQATGVVLAPFGLGPIPPEVFEATVDVHGWVGLLPSLVVDGGAAVLVVLLLVFRRHWTRSTSRRTRSRSPHRAASPVPR